MGAGEFCFGDLGKAKAVRIRKMQLKTMTAAMMMSLVKRDFLKLK